MLIAEIIRKKRDGLVLSAKCIAQMVEGIASNDASEGQVAAFAMAVFFNGMTPSEAAALTLAMRDSGEVFTWDVPGPVVDKHSTGGVGDNLSLMLAPIVAAAGGYVPMISGRGLGHTGGTLDKMDAIPGYTSQPDNEKFRKVVRDVGCAIIGQTGNLAPADKRFYGIRDVTATVESVPLITASILSKKLAAGLQSLVMDVKCGSGAFMQSRDDARALARSITHVAQEAGLTCHALITDMNEPLARAAGNAVEVLDAIEFLHNPERNARQAEVVFALTGEMLLTAGLAASREEGIAKSRRVVQNGQAAETFGRMVAALGGPTDFVERANEHLPKAPVVKEVPAQMAGHVTSIQTRDIGLAVVELGGGRQRAADRVDPAVGLTSLLGIGEAVDIGAPLGIIHAANEESAQAAIQAVQAAYGIGESTRVTSPILEIIPG
ncbi:MAG: thymidine phosphorylase [Maritimibacter sp.]